MTEQGIQHFSIEIICILANLMRYGPISVSEAINNVSSIYKCLIPSSTGHRYAEELLNKKYISMYDGHDRRCKYLEITDQGCMILRKELDHWHGFMSNLIKINDWYISAFNFTNKTINMPHEPSEACQPKRTEQIYILSCLIYGKKSGTNIAIYIRDNYSYTVPPATLYNHINIMNERAWIIIDGKDPNDSRCNLFCITEEGEHVLRQECWRIMKIFTEANKK